MSGDVLPHMIYLDHGDTYTFNIHVYVKGADWLTDVAGPRHTHCDVFVKPRFYSGGSGEVCPLLLRYTSELWWLSVGKRGDYQNCSVLY